jgi:hypothetical protein
MQLDREFVRKNMRWAGTFCAEKNSGQPKLPCLFGDPGELRW